MKVKVNHNLFKNQKAFSLIEVIAVITISALILIAVLNVYGRVQSTAASINSKIDNQLLPNEVIQRIAEDIDRLTLPGLETTISVANKMDGDFNLTRMIITTKFYGTGSNPKAEVYEEVIWQSDYDPVEDAIVLYRLHDGLNLEDKIVDLDLEGNIREDRNLFVPITSGITFFEILVPQGENEFREWKLSNLPRAIRVRISFVQPEEDMTGEFVLYDEDKMTRTIAIDRTRAIRYKFEKKEFKAEEEDPNDISGDSAMDDEGEGESADSAAEDESATTEGEGPSGEREKSLTGSEKE